MNGEVIGERPFRAGTEQQMVREYASANGLGKLGSRDDLPRGHKSKFDAFARRRMRELTGQVPAKTTYQEWLSRQPTEIQDDILGPTRGKLFRDGGLTLDRFVNREGDELTLDELRQRNRKAFERAGLAGASATERREAEAAKRAAEVARLERERAEAEERARRAERERAEAERARQRAEAQAAEERRRRKEEEQRRRAAESAKPGIRSGRDLVSGTSANYAIAGAENEISEAMVSALDRVGYREMHRRTPGHLHLTDRVVEFRGTGTGANRLLGHRSTLEDNSVPSAATAFYNGNLRLVRMSTRPEDYRGAGLGLRESVDTTQRSSDGAPLGVPGGTTWIAKTKAEEAAMVAVHEFGHDVHLNEHDLPLQSQIDRVVLRHWHAAKREATSTYGNENHQEFFAEAFTAYWHYPPGWMARNAPRSLEMVEEVLQLRGMPLNPAARGGQRE